MDAIERSEGFFPGTSDKWGYWRSFSEKDGDGSVNKTAIAGEYNGGILIFDDEEHMTGDDIVRPFLFNIFLSNIRKILLFAVK